MWYHSLCSLCVPYVCHLRFLLPSCLIFCLSDGVHSLNVPGFTTSFLFFWNALLFHSSSRVLLPLLLYVFTYVYVHSIADESFHFVCFYSWISKDCVRSRWQHISTCEAKALTVVLLYSLKRISLLFSREFSSFDLLCTLVNLDIVNLKVYM